MDDPLVRPVSRRFTFICALLLSSHIAFASDARAQSAPMTVTILRRTAVHTNPSFAAPTIAFLNPSTFEVTQLRVDDGFVRLLLRQIDRRSASGYGYITAADVAVDSGATNTVAARPPPLLGDPGWFHSPTCERVARRAALKRTASRAHR